MMDSEALETILLSAVEAARFCGVGCTLWLAMNNSGRIPLPVHLGKRVLWVKQDLIDWTNNRLPNGELMSREKWILFKETRKC